MLRFCLLLLPVLLIACGDPGQSSSSSAAGDSSQAESNAPPEGNFYKRYSGSIDGRPVVLQLHRYAGKIRGSYQYLPDGQIVGLRNWMDTAADEEYLLTEIMPDHTDDAAWSIRLQGRKVIGQMRRGGDSLVNIPFSLQEDYPAGSIRLTANYLADSAALFTENRASPKAVTTCSYLLPVETGNGFLYEALRAQLVPGSREGTEIVSAIKTGNAAYFETYRKDNAPLFKGPDDAEAALFALGYTRDEVVTVLYNDHFWLVTEAFRSDFTGGAHGNYGSSFANIDLQGQRLWRLSDMISDTLALRPLLNDAAIMYFRLRPDDHVGQRLLVSEVPVTPNVYLTASGLSFVYNPYEIASYAAGQITLFLPYSKLMPYLSPAFKARMQLSERSGVAMLSVHP